MKCKAFISDRQTYFQWSSNMGRLNKKITAKVGKPLAKQHGLSRSNLAVTAAIIAKKEALSAALASGDLATVITRPQPIQLGGAIVQLNHKETASSPESTIALFSKAPTKKALRATVGAQSRGVGKKDRRRIRSDLLHKRLAAAEAAKQEVKAKKVRERTVIVKDIQPLLADLQDIEEDIKKVIR